nr:UvrD-helicase domain-containing protein [Spirochaetales bacterium]
MNDPYYLLLLNERLKKEIISLSAKKRERLFEKFSYLENGLWDAGVKVKKMKGPSGKVVFEGRISKGDRIIFTLGREYGRPCIYLWGTVHHDEVSREVYRVSPENAPFLNFEPVSETSLDELVFDELSEDLFTQESIEQKVQDDYGPQKWLEIGEHQLKRLFGETQPDFFEIYLHLTGEQQQVLELAPPILLSGTAGSGKTTLTVYYLLKGSYSGQKTVFITCSKYLKEYSERLFRGLVVNSPLEKAAQNVQFSILRELILEILKDTGCNPDPKLEVGLKQFRAIFSKHALARKYDSELVWEEIRSIIKGASPPVDLIRFKGLVSRYQARSLDINQLRQLKEMLFSLEPLDFTKKIERIIEHKSSCTGLIDFVQKLTLPDKQADSSFAFVLSEIVRIAQSKETRLSSPLLTLPEYLNLGKKRAPNFLYDREEIYDIALYYQSQLELEKRYDEIDLCRIAISALEKAGQRFQHDLVVCDEVQDFSDIQLTFLFKLAATPGNIICAGDPKQIINPSGFRWEELKNRFYERGLSVPDVRHLNLNFRCVGSIVRLSNALLVLKQQLVGISGYERMEKWKFNGRPPILIHGIPEQEMSRQIRTTAAGRVVLVRSDQEKRHLKMVLQTELVFTILEAKGLEFETVFLWKFSSDVRSAEIWRKIAGEHYLSLDHYPLIRHEINLLYVAVTRARNTLIIYDGQKPSPVWLTEELSPHVFMTQEKERLQEMWMKVSSPDEWGKQGDYFFEREYYQVARECYHNAGNAKMSDISFAHQCKSDNRHLEAAGHFATWGMKLEAAKAFEDAKEYARALSLWKELRKKDQAARCEILLLEDSGKYAEAASLWVKVKCYDRAVENWKLAKAYTQLGDFLYKKKSYREAAEYYLADRQSLKAARSYARLKQTKTAADLYVEGGDFTSALPLYKRLKDYDQMLLCCRKLEDYYQIGLIHEKRKEFTLSIAAFTKYADGPGEHAER